MKVCERCLEAIESREGKQPVLAVYFDDNCDMTCDWCEENGFDKLYKIGGQ